MKSLEGKSVTSVFISEDKTYLKFDLSDGSSKLFFTDGDCCSYSWIEHVSGSNCLKNAVIFSVENVEMPEVEQQDEYDYIQSYGVRIKTSKGYFDLEFRNESNGYYGGSIEEVGIFYSKKESFKELEDF